MFTVGRTLDQILRSQNLGEVAFEFERAMTFVESDPPAAVTAACAMTADEMEFIFKRVVAKGWLHLRAC